MGWKHRRHALPLRPLLLEALLQLLGQLLPPTLRLRGACCCCRRGWVACGGEVRPRRAPGCGSDDAALTGRSAAGVAVLAACTATTGTKGDAAKRGCVGARTAVRSGGRRTGGGNGGHASASGPRAAGAPAAATAAASTQAAMLLLPPGSSPAARAAASAAMLASKGAVAAAEGSFVLLATGSAGGEGLHSIAFGAACSAAGRRPLPLPCRAAMCACQPGSKPGF